MPATDLPKRVYVTWDGDTENADDPYLVCDITADNVDHGAIVGVYELREIRIKHITHTLE